MPELTLANGQRLFYLDPQPAAAQPVLLLHGLGASSASWQLQIPVLSAAGYRPIAPDLPGFGQSGYRPGGPRIAQMAHAVQALAGALKLPPAALIGISMGGTVALQLALQASLQASQLAASLMLVNTFARLELGSPRLLPYYALRFILVHTLGIEIQARAVAKRIFPLPEQEVLRQNFIAQVRQANPHAYRATLRAFTRFNLEPHLGCITQPALVVTAAGDTIVAPSNQLRLARGLPNARQAIIPAAGHGVTAEKSSEFNQIMIKFLRTPNSMEAL